LIPIFSLVTKLDISSLYTNPVEPVVPSICHGSPKSRAMDGNLPLAKTHGRNSGLPRIAPNVRPRIIRRIMLKR